MNCKVCGSTMQVVKKLEGVWFNLITYKCNCGRIVQQNIKRQTKGGKR